MTNVQEMLCQLREYQKEDVNWMIGAGRGLNYLDMRLGKTLETLTAIQCQWGLPCLIICPKYALGVWQSEIEKWTKAKSFVLTGKPKDRARIWEEFKACETEEKYLITNYAFVEEAIANFNGWKGCIADEIHTSGLFNHKSKTYKIFAKHISPIKHLWLLTGTPLRQGCIDLFGPLSLIDPKRFNSYWAFVTKHCVTIKDTFGTSIERNPKNPEAFRTMLGRYMLRRVKTEVFRELPPKMRNVINCEMNAEQRKAYDELLENMFTLIDNPAADQNILMSPSLLGMNVRLRQLLTSPQSLGFKHPGGAIDKLCELSHEYLDENQGIVIYTAFRSAIPSISQALRNEYGYQIEEFFIHGGLSAEQFTRAWQGYEKCNTRKVLYCVIKSGASFKVSSAKAGYVLGCEWDFTLNEQAEDRMYSPDNPDPVIVNYLLYPDTIDAAVKSKLNQKYMSSNLVVGTTEQYAALRAQWEARRK